MSDASNANVGEFDDASREGEASALISYLAGAREVKAEMTALKAVLRILDGEKTP